MLKESNVSDSFKDYCSNYKRIYYKTIREAKRQFNDKYIKQAENKSKALWEIAKREIGKQKPYSNLKINDGDKLITDPFEISNIFNDYYTNIARNITFTHKQSQQNPVIDQANRDTIFLTPTTVDEIRKIIQNLKNKRSSGVDEIPDFLLKILS